MTYKEMLKKSRELGIGVRQLDIAFEVENVIEPTDEDFERICKYIERVFYGWTDQTKSTYQACLKFKAFLEDGYSVDEILDMQPYKVIERII